ncbi:putative DD41D transposase [Trichonephila clavipes]|nr:putative DD41D transposase [Trichonephila clavipes]
MITNFFIPEFNNHDIQELWFQQDGARCHTALVTIDLLKDTLGDRLISRFGPVNWPPRSCDLTPLDYFLWGYVKSLVYADRQETLDYLEDNIHHVIVEIRLQMLEKIIENWTSRLYYIRASRGSPMPEIIFKIIDISAHTLLRPLLSTTVLGVATVAQRSKYRTRGSNVVSSNLVASKDLPCRVGRLTLNKSRLERPSVGVEFMREECQLRCHPRYLTIFQKYVIRCHQEPRSAE